MSIDRLIESWKDVRNGLIDEAAQVPLEPQRFRELSAKAAANKATLNAS